MSNAGAFLLILSVSGVSFGANTVRLYSIKCDTNPEMLANVTCGLRAISRTLIVANMDSDLVKPVSNVTLEVVFFKRSSVQFRPWIISVKFNVCQFLGSKSVFGVVQATLMKVLALHSNVNHSCPFTGHLKAKNLHLDPKYLPFSIPEGKYRVDFKFSEGYPSGMVLIGLCQLFVDIGESLPEIRRNKVKT